MKLALASALAALLALAAPSSAGEISGPLTFETLGGDSAIPTALQTIAREPKLNLAPEITGAGLGFYTLIAAEAARTPTLDATPQELLTGALARRRREAAAHLAAIKKGTSRNPIYDKKKITALAALHVLSPLLTERQLATLATLSRGAQEEIARRAAAYMDRERSPLAVEDMDPGELAAQFAARSQKKISNNLTEQENVLLQRQAARVDWTHEPDYAQPLASLARRKRPLREMIASVRRRGAPLRIADVGSGLGSALGQWADENPEADDALTAVDRFNWRKLDPQRAERAVSEHQDTVHSSCLFPNGPNHVFMLADAATARFPEPQDFILLSHALNFMPDKLKVLLNLYDQLEVGGIMAVLSPNLTGMIRGDRIPSSYREPPSLIARFVNALVLLRAEAVGLSSRTEFSLENMGVLLIRRHSTARLSMPHLRLARVERDADGGLSSVYVPNEGSAPEQAFNTPFAWTDPQ